MNNPLVPSDVNRKPVVATVAITPPAAYLPDFRLKEIRDKAEGYSVNNSPAIPIRCEDALAIIDELRDLRTRTSSLSPRRSWWRRLRAWIGGVP